MNRGDTLAQHRQPLRRQRAGHPPLERACASHRYGGPVAAHHERPRAECQPRQSAPRAARRRPARRQKPSAKQVGATRRRESTATAPAKSGTSQAKTGRRRAVDVATLRALSASGRGPKTKQATRLRVACFSSAGESRRIAGGLAAGSGLQLLGGFFFFFFVFFLALLRFGAAFSSWSPSSLPSCASGRPCSSWSPSSLPCASSLLGGLALLGRLLRCLALRCLLRSLALRGGLLLGRLLRLLLRARPSWSPCFFDFPFGRLLRRRSGYRHHRHNVSHSLISCLSFCNCYGASPSSQAVLVPSFGVAIFRGLLTNPFHLLHEF